MNLIQAVVEILLIASASFFLFAAVTDGRPLRRPARAPEVRESVRGVPERTFTPQVTAHTALD